MEISFFLLELIERIFNFLTPTLHKILQLRLVSKKWNLLGLQVYEYNYGWLLLLIHTRKGMDTCGLAERIRYDYFLMLSLLLFVSFAFSSLFLENSFAAIGNQDSSNNVFWRSFRKLLLCHIRSTTLQWYIIIIPEKKT